MNERIRELWSQSVQPHTGDSWAEQTEFMARFAQLVAKECMTIAQEYDGAKLGGPGLIIAMRIEQHFGVEE